MNQATQSPPETSTKSTSELKAINDACIINTYGARKLAMVRGEGTTLWDAEGNEYLDFFAGIAVVNLGHCHPVVTEAIAKQAQTLVHVSNLYYIEPQSELAALLTQHSFAERWFFCNSGTEATEAAVKLVRRYWSKKGTPKPDIVCADSSFHGRSSAAMSATGQPKYREGYEPALPGFSHVPFNDIDALEKAITPSVGAVFLEPIQGEGGVNVADEDYFKKVRELCDQKNVLLVLDEIQTGLGRTGTLFAHEKMGFTPDVMLIAKGLGNGVPIGAVGCTEEIAAGFDPGMHGSTFGGNPLCTAAGVATLSVMLEPGFLDQVAQVGRYFKAGLKELQSKHASIIDVRGEGMMLGVELNVAGGPAIAGMLDKGIICGPAGANIVRFLPPLIVTQTEVDRVLQSFDDVLGSM